MKTKQRSAYYKMVIAINELDAQHISVASLSDSDPRLLHIQKLGKQCGENIDNKDRELGPTRKYQRRSKLLTEREYRMVQDIISGMTMAETSETYDYTTDQIYRVCHLARVTARPIFRYKVMTKNRKHRIYFVTRRQLKTAINQTFNILLPDRTHLETQLAKYGMGLNRGNYHWYDINDGDMYSPRRDITILTKTSIESYGIKTTMRDAAKEDEDD